MNWRLIALAPAMTLCAGQALAADDLKIGFITTLSGPAGVIGKHMQDAANLALEMLGGKVGKRPAAIIYRDDQFRPDVGSQDSVELLKKDKVESTIFTAHKDAYYTECKMK